MEARTPSIRDVAQAAGVSQQTVSRVLNNHPSVRPSTRADVQQAIERLGYRRNAAARALASKHTNILGATVTNPQMFGPSGALLAIDRAARQAGFWLSVAFIRNQTAADMDDTLHHFLDLGAEGVVVIAPNPATLDAASAMAGKIPMVLATSGQSTLPAVDNDQAAGARAAVEHLIGLGHRRIGHISGADDEFHATIRQQAWLDALAQAGLEPGPCLRGDWLPASGYAAGRQLLADGDLPTAVFVANDQMCQGLLRAFAETGVRCPDDVSLVGFDDFLGTDQYTPPLTTVRQDFSLLGEVCVEMLLAQISGGPTPARSLVPELVIRKSTAPPR